MADNNSKIFSVLVVGTGAIGGFYGAMLARAGADVSVVCRSDYEKVSSDGIEVISAFGNHQFRPRQVLNSCAQCAKNPDYILVTLKVLPEIEPAALIHDAVGPSTTIVLLQNGVDVEQSVASAFPENKIVSALAFVCVVRPAPAVVHHQDYGPVILGDFPAGISDETRTLGELFQKAGVPVTLTEHVQIARWVKLIWNAPFNNISVLSGGCDTRQIMDSTELSDLARCVMEEVHAIATAIGYPLPEGIIEKNLMETRKMTAYRPSMLQDYQAGRPLEVEAILGNALRRARGLNVPVPCMETMYALMLQMDTQSQGKS